MPSVRASSYLTEGFPLDPYCMERVFENAETCIANGDKPIAAMITHTKEEWGRLYERPVAYGRNEVEYTGHPLQTAVIQAIQKASIKLGRRELASSVLYINHEPTFMEAGAIANSKLAGIVYSTSWDDMSFLFSDDPNFAKPTTNIRASDVIHGREEKGASPQFIISGFMRERGLDVWRKNGLLICHKDQLALNPRQPRS